MVVDDGSELPASAVLAEFDDARLRVCRASHPTGAAAARNFGAAKARGEVLLFLDDDDEMISDYCRRVMDAAEGSAVWGYCSTLEQHGEAGQQSTLQRRRRRLPRSGLVSGGPLRDHIAALSEGLWIQRQLFLDLGGLRAEQIVDEDTDFCCLLYRLGHRPWYEAEPGVVVHKGYSVTSGQAAQLTRSTPRQLQLDAYLRTFERHQAELPERSEARWFLCARYLRLAAKSDNVRQVRTLLRSLAPGVFFLKASVYWWFKRGVQIAKLRRSKALAGNFR